MKIQAFKRGIIGFPLGIALGYIITIIISLFSVNGEYSPCVPALAEQLGSELRAVILQAVMSGLLGASCAASSVIWENDRWSIAKQTGVYFSVLSLTMLPVAYISHWMEHSIIGFLSYFGIFVAIFITVWITQYFTWKRKIEKLNARVQDKRSQH